MMAAQPVVKSPAEQFRFQEHLVLTMILLSVVSCAPVRIWPYINQRGHCSSDCTRANYKVEAREKSDGMFVGLALSGGGSRSANFSSAVMLELQRLGILQRVDFISSVSGGSLPAAYYALAGYKYFTLGGYESIAFEEDEVRDRMGRNFQDRWILSWFDPLNILRYWFTDFTRSDIMVPVFDSNLFHGATFANLNPNRPKLLINATNMGKLARFTFSDEAAAGLKTDLSSFSIARAVNVSSAFPGAFQTITMQDFSKDDTYLHLYDGGPADNLGVTVLHDEVLLPALCEGVQPPPRSRRDITYQGSEPEGPCPNKGFPKPVRDVFPGGCLVMAVDAATLDFERYANQAHIRRWSDYVIDSNVMNATDVMLLRNREKILRQFGITDPDSGQDRFSTFLKHNNGSACEFWHIALRHIRLDDKQFGDVHKVETSFNIEPKEEEVLFAAAKHLIEEGRKAVGAKEKGWGETLKALFLQSPGVR